MHMKFSKEWIIPALLGLGLVISVALKFDRSGTDTQSGEGTPPSESGSQSVSDIKYIQFSKRHQGKLIVDDDTTVFCQISFLGATGGVIKNIETSGKVKVLPPVIRDMSTKLGVGGQGFAIVPYSTFFADGGGDPSLPEGEDVRLNLEVRDFIPKGKELGADGKKIGLVLIDMDKSGIAETLKGGNWEKGVKNDSWLDKNHTREIKVDGRVENREWVGPRTGVFMIGRKTGEVSMEDLVGTYTGGIDWDSGYDVLSQYDQEEDGILRSRELDELFVWVDQNSNAVAEENEITPAGELFSTIRLQPSELTGNKARRKDGVKLKDNSNAGTWEWKTRGNIKEN